VSVAAPTGDGDGLAGATATGVEDRQEPPRRRGLDPAERRRVMDAVAMRREDGWYTSFGIMMALSVVVAAMGISLDSPAVVIGAMLLAPLMTPVLGVAASLAMALPRHLGQALGVVVVASVLSVVLAALISGLLSNTPLPDELLARTSPDLRDLLVALAAGAAGAYATVRPDVSSSLPGVAVAVALVPPLAAAGMALEAGRGDLASGAALLYLANLAAIVLVGTAVFLLTGFVPVTRLRNARRRVIGGGVLVVLATVAVAVPLTVASLGAAEAGRSRTAVSDAAVTWAAGTGLEVDEVRIDGDVVRLRLSGPEPPPSTAPLEDEVRAVLGPDAVVEVRWTQTQGPTGTGGVDPTTDEQLVNRLVNEWLADAPGRPTVTAVQVTTDRIGIELSATEPPPPTAALLALLGAEGIEVEVVVDWTRRDDATQQLVARVEAAAVAWASTRPTVAVVGVTSDGTAVNVDAAAPDAAALDGLAPVLEAAAGADTPVRIWLLPRLAVPAAGP
jgi:uncharacterized hydrophobic protein (TIGR00271 family)